VKDIEHSKDEILRLARLSDVTIKEKGDKIKSAAGDVVNGIEIFIPLGGLVDTEKEKIRLQKEIEQLTGYTKGLSSKLSNANFVKNAPQAIVEAERARLSEAENKLKKLKEQLDNL
jgi:valyl-tRNA synthetase